MLRGIAAACVAAAVVACGGGDDGDDDKPDTRTYRVPAESMAPTIEIDERITVDLAAYDDAEPQLGEIVVVHPPVGAVDESGTRCGDRVDPAALCPRPTRDLADVEFVKRVVAGPGDEVRIVDGRVIRNGSRADEPFAQRCPDRDTCTFRGSLRVPDDHWFVMGDNRGASDDSRFWGPVPRRAFVGRVEE